MKGKCVYICFLIPFAISRMNTDVFPYKWPFIQPVYETLKKKGYACIQKAVKIKTLHMDIDLCKRLYVIFIFIFIPFTLTFMSKQNTKKKNTI